MKTKNKVLLILTCMCLIVATTVMATMAYLQDTAEVVNTFTVGNVKLLLDEKDVNPDGTEIPGAARVTGNEYHLIPGLTYTKDPTVTVMKDSEECYVRMLVTINCKSALDTILPGADLKTIFNDYNAVWEYATETVNADTITYEFRYATTVTPDGTNNSVLEPLFKSFTVPGTLDGEDLEKIKDLEITVVAHAIQAAGFTSEDAAWAEFVVQTQP